MWEDCLAHVFWGVLDDSCRHFSNPLSPEAARERYMDLKSVRFPGTRMAHMAEKLTCNEPLTNVSVLRQWLGRGATAAARYQSLRPIRKYQGGWQPTEGYPPYAPKKQVKYGHHLFFMPNNEVHGRVGQLQPEAPGVGQHMVEREKSGIILGTVPRTLYRGGKHRGAPYNSRHNVELQQEQFQTAYQQYMKAGRGKILPTAKCKGF